MLEGHGLDGPVAIVSEKANGVPARATLDDLEPVALVPGRNITAVEYAIFFDRPSPAARWLRDKFRDLCKGGELQCYDATRFLTLPLIRIYETISPVALWTSVQSTQLANFRCLPVTLQPAGHARYGQK